MEKAPLKLPEKRYFTIGEVSALCGVKPYVLRYWEQEFAQLKPMKRRGNRRYYQHHEVLLVRRIRDLLYDQGFTIVGARNRLADAAAALPRSAADLGADEFVADELPLTASPPADRVAPAAVAGAPIVDGALGRDGLREELLSIRELLTA